MHRSEAFHLLGVAAGAAPAGLASVFKAPQLVGLESAFQTAIDAAVPGSTSGLSSTHLVKLPSAAALHSLASGGDETPAAPVTLHNGEFFLRTAVVRAPIQT